MNKKIVLIDMDGTIADFNKSLLKKIKEMGMGDLEKKDMTHFRTEKNFSIEHWSDIINIISQKDFYFDLESIEDSIKYVKEIFAHPEIDAFFCTSPLLSEYCIPEKQKWIIKYFGEEYLKKIIFSKDKTLVLGDILIDDKPLVEGIREKNQSWEHIYFDQPYNRNGVERRRIKDWKNWKEIILDKKDK